MESINLDRFTINVYKGYITIDVYVYEPRFYIANSTFTAYDDEAIILLF